MGGRFVGTSRFSPEFEPAQAERRVAIARPEKNKIEDFMP
jgi:hypothetical protein